MVENRFQECMKKSSFWWYINDCDTSWWSEIVGELRYVDNQVTHSLVDNMARKSPPNSSISP